MPGFLSNSHNFKHKYEIPISQGEKKISKELNKKIQPFILRRVKEKVNIDLKEKEEVDVYIEMNEKQQDLYYKMSNEIYEELKVILQESTLNKNKMLILEKLLRLRQISISPKLVIPTFDDIGQKINVLMEKIKEIHEKGEKVLIFSSFKKALILATKTLEEQTKIKYLTLTGEKKSTEREGIVEKFNNDEKITAMFISLKAGGVGLNLTSATNVIILDPWWNIAAQMQAIDRAYRIGQTKKVTVYKYITKNTVEEKILKLQQKKKKLSDTIVTNSKNYLKGATEKDIFKLFKK